MSKVTLRQLRQHLAAKSHADLIEDIITLSKRNPAVKDFFTVQLDGSYDEACFEKHKRIVTNEFFPDWPTFICIHLIWP
jgi:hypothetical protein